MASSNSPVLGEPFSPTDKELIGRYLFHKIEGRLSPMERNLIRDCDLYAEQPNQVWKRFKQLQNSHPDQEEMFFFTKLKRIGKYKDGSRIGRMIGRNKEGLWREEKGGVDVPVQVIETVNGVEKITDLKGKKKIFKYMNISSEQNLVWIMDEYSVGNYDQDWVLCRLRKNANNADEQIPRKRIQDCEIVQESSMSKEKLVSSPGPSEFNFPVCKNDSNFSGEEWPFRRLPNNPNDVGKQTPRKRTSGNFAEPPFVSKAREIVQEPPISEEEVGSPSPSETIFPIIKNDSNYSDEEWPVRRLPKNPKNGDEQTPRNKTSGIDQESPMSTEKLLRESPLRICINGRNTSDEERAPRRLTKNPNDDETFASAAPKPTMKQEPARKAKPPQSDGVNVEMDQELPVTPNQFTVIVREDDNSIVEFDPSQSQAASTVGTPCIEFTFEIKCIRSRRLE